MTGTTETKRAYAEGRADQYRELMQAFAAVEGHYKGVRGALLAKVRAELEKTKPTGATLSVVSTPSTGTAASNPTCRACGREMKLNGTDGRLVCQNGHVR